MARRRYVTDHGAGLQVRPFSLRQKSTAITIYASHHSGSRTSMVQPSSKVLEILKDAFLDVEKSPGLSSDEIECIRQIAIRFITEMSVRKSEETETKATETAAV